nr:MAG TPA: hypothetical protein [Caudoviricetes sp.]
MGLRRFIMCYEIFLILIVFIVGLAVIDKLDDDLK